MNQPEPSSQIVKEIEPQKRKKPMSPLISLAAIPAGILFLILGFTTINDAVDMGILKSVGSMVGGGVLLLGGLWDVFSPTSGRNLLLKSPVRTKGSIDIRYKEDKTDSWGGKNTRYHLVFTFRARPMSQNPSDVTLDAQVEKSVYEMYKERKIVSIQYAEADPKIALLEGEF